MLRPSSTSSESRMIRRIQPRLNTHRWRTQPHQRRRSIRMTANPASTLKHIDAKTSQHTTFQKHATVYLPVYEANPTFQTGKSLSLSGLLNHHTRTANSCADVIVTRVPGRRDYTNYTVLRRIYGKSRTALFAANTPTRQGDLCQLLPVIRRFGGVIRISPRRSTRHRHHVKKDLAKLAHLPARTTLLRKMHPHDILWTYFKANMLPKADRRTLRNRITHILRRYHHMPPLKNLCVRVPINFYPRRRLYALAHNIMGARVISPAAIRQ